MLVPHFLHSLVASFHLLTKKASHKACLPPPAGVKSPHNFTPPGALAQLVERLHRTQQVRGSNPLCSILITS